MNQQTKPKTEAADDRPAPQDETIPVDEPEATSEAQSEEPAPADGLPPEPDPVETLKAEAEELRDRLMRTMADMENLRRRTEREKQDASRYAIARFAEDVLSVGDNLGRALATVDDGARAAADDATKHLIEGIEVTERGLQNVLSRHGIVRLEPDGERSDPNFHQAMFEVENPAVPSGTVVQVVQAGYTIGDRVLRPALVGVSKGGPKVGPENGDRQAADKSGQAEKPATPGDASEPGAQVDKEA